MSKILIGLTVIVTLFGLGFLLLNGDYSSVDSLIRPPKIDGENSDIQAAFEFAVGEKYTLKAPLTGEHRTSFIRTDIDGDKTDEVVVFYSRSDAVDVVRMNVLDERDGVWESVADLESAYNDVYQVSFANIDNDIHNEIVVCWRNFENDISNKLNVYKIANNKGGYLETVFSKNYNEFLISDIDRDDCTDIVIFEKNNSGNISEIKGIYYGFNTGESVVNGEFSIDPSIISIGNVCSDSDSSDNNIRIYIDGYKSDSNMSTDVVKWNAEFNVFEKIKLRDYSTFTTVTSRNININCSDVNNDGQIDIPIEVNVPESKVLTADLQNVSTEQNAIKWSNLNNNVLDLLHYEIMNSKFSYSIRLSGDVFENLTVVNNTLDGVMTFYELIYDDYPEKKPEKDKKPKKKDEPFDKFESESSQNSESGYIPGDALFEIVAAKESDYGSYEFSGYKYIGKNYNYNYYCRISERGKVKGITKDKIKSILLT